MSVFRLKHVPGRLAGWGGGEGDPRQICVNLEKDWTGELWQSGGENATNKGRGGW
jgi:hypothetical protein